ncbi:citrate lyase subunit beta/citryl-CoA lyase [Murinocardiopsis flavida]|uniref:Citrate lyase subunit beta/citryl-CoA lyase n=1 Tax=Murinocardiopsis flavida TaxID=645275 RepID=A0A2P8DRZ0_9ACTN|nr:CoA ester lyase [Murinocardiopsis flavida]PSK99954.1 citrate lyase subunit beta/citryl-CoA lyase [Murinocardiopsis flavida]
MAAAAPDVPGARSGPLAAAVTWLFVPAARPDRFAKALRSGADAVILDLEDSVSAADKDAAREALATAWPADAGTPGTPAVAVRVNGLNSAEFAADAAACRALRPAAVVLPKAESAHDVRSAAEAVAAPVLPLIESARGLVDLRDIAGCPESARLLFGTVDLALDLGVTADAALDTARGDLVRWSAACALPPPVDGVTTALRDADTATRDAARAREWGFGGKLCVHPAQVQPVAAAFAPGAAELEWAREVLALEHEGAAARDGEMIDRPVVERARRILLRAGQSGPGQG